MLVVNLLPKLLTQNLIPWILRKWRRNKVEVALSWWEAEFTKVGGH
jgi:hypothetical protein